MNKHTGRITYTERLPAGTAGQSALVFLHGIGGDSHSFAPQLEAFGNRFRCIAWNMPGYRTSEPLSSMSFEALAGALRHLLDELALPRVHLIGQSIGGMVAQEFYVSDPSRVASLTLIATTAAFGGRDDTFRRQFVADRLAPLEQGVSMPDLAERFIPEILGSAATADARTSAIRSLAAVPVSTWRQVIECLVTFDRWDDSAHIAVPTCLIAGSEDRNAPARTMQKLAARIPGADFHCIEGAGHLVNLECPAEVNPIIEAFVAGNDH